MDNVYLEIDKNFSEYTNTRFTRIKIELLLLINYQLNTFCLKLEIKKNNLIVHKRLNEITAGSVFVRRGESMIKLIECMLTKIVIPDCIFYIAIYDQRIYYDVPIFIYAKPKNKKGLLIPDHTFIDAEPEYMHINKYYNISAIRKDMNRINTTSPKINELFFAGQDIALKNSNVNIRRFFSEQPLPFNVTLNKYVPMSEFSKYNYLLNLSGRYAWSFRFKFLFIAKSLVINVGCYWEQVFDPLFIPNVDYINIPVSSDLNSMKYSILESINKNNNTINTIITSGYNKGKLLTLKTVYSVLYYCINKWRIKFNDIKPSISKSPTIKTKLFCKKIPISLYNKEAYNEIEFYDTIEKNGYAHLFIPLIKFEIKGDFLILKYVKGIPLPMLMQKEKISDNDKIKRQINALVDVIQSLNIKIYEPARKNYKNIIFLNGQYYLSNFKNYILPEIL